VLIADELGLCLEIPPPVAPRHNAPNSHMDVRTSDVSVDPVVRLRHRHRTHEVQAGSVVSTQALE